MTNLEFFSRLLLATFGISSFVLIAFIIYSYTEHLNTNLDLIRDGKIKNILLIYKHNKNRFTKLPTYNDKYCYELFRRPNPRQDIHFYPYKIEVHDWEENSIYYLTLDFFDFLIYMLYFYIIFRFTAKKPKQPLDLLKINNRMKPYI